MEINYIDGPCGSGKTTKLNELYRKFSKQGKKVYLTGGNVSTKGIIETVEKMARPPYSTRHGGKIDVLLIDNEGPRRIGFAALSSHPALADAVVYVTRVTP